MYLFDTDIIVALLRGQSDSALRRRIVIVPPARQFISAISVSELVYGAWRSQRPQHHLNKIRDNVVQSVQVLSFDSPAAWLAGRLRAELAKVGTPLDFPDLQIAAIALTQSLTVVTGNTKHFGRVPNLQVADWLNQT